MDREQRYLELYNLSTSYVRRKHKQIDDYEQEDLIQDIATFLLPRLVEKENINDNYVFKSIENYIKRLKGKKGKEIKCVSLDNEAYEGITFHDIIPDEPIPIDMILELKLQGFSEKRISEITDLDIKIIRKHIKGGTL